jgi:hypothetical protein
MSKLKLHSSGDNHTVGGYNLVEDALCFGMHCQGREEATRILEVLSSDDCLHLSSSMGIELKLFSFQFHLITCSCVYNSPSGGLALQVQCLMEGYENLQHDTEGIIDILVIRFEFV